MRDAGPSSPPVASISVGASAAGPRPGVPAPMPDFRDRERDEADAQAKNTARQREVLRERAARRAKERRKEAKKAAQAQTVAGNAPAPGAVPAPPPRASSLAASRAPPSRGPPETQWGLAPSEWTGDVGGALVTLQSENLTLRRERARWAAERAELEAKLRAGAGMGPFGRVTTPSPPPPSIPESDDNIPGGASAGAGGAEGGAEGDAGATGASSRAAPPEQRSPPPAFGDLRAAFEVAPDDDDAPVGPAPPPARTIEDIYDDEIRDPDEENRPPVGRRRGGDPSTSSDARDANSSSPLGPVGDALEQLSGAEAMTALMMAEMRASRGAVADLRREMRLERERAAQAEARQRRLLEQTRRAADAAVMTAESVAENQKNHMAKAMQAAETRTQSLEMLVPTGKRKKQQTEAAYTAADVAENALTKISEMVPGSTGDLEEQQEMLRRRRFDRHAARLGQISAAASAIAISTVHANAARLQALKEKNAKGTQTEDALDKFLYCKVMTDYFLPAVLLSPEEKAELERKRKREALAAVEAQRRWALAVEREGTYGRESRYWLLRREAKDQESESTDAIASAFADAERVVLKAIRKNHKSALQKAPAGYLGADARAIILGAVASAESRAMDAIERVRTSIMAEIEAGQLNGFFPLEERQRLDARMRKMTALLSALLADFEKEIKAVCTAPDPGRDAACAPAANVKPTGVFADVANIMAPAAARLKLASEQTRADAAALAADQSVPLKHVLDRAESIAKEAIPRALKPILPALRAARNMGKLDPSGVGAMMVDVDAAEARVSAVLEAIAPAAAFACWQTQHTRVGPASGPGSSRRMKPLRPDDPTEGLAEEHEMDQRREDALEKIGKCLRESRTRLLLLTRDAHKKIEDVMAGDGEPGTATEGIPALPARVANGVLAVTARLREAATNWGALLDDAGEQEHYAVGGVAAKLVRKARAVAEFAPRRLLDAGDAAKNIMASCTEIYFPVLGPPPPPPPPPANLAIPFLHLEEKTWKKGDEPEDIPEDPPEIGFLELEAEVDAAVATVRDAGEVAAGRIEAFVDAFARSIVFRDDAADPHDVDAVAPATETEVVAVTRAAETLAIRVMESLDDLREDAKDAAAIVRTSAMPAHFDYDEDYDPIKNRKGKCEDPDDEIPKDHRVNKLDCKSAGVRVRTAEENARARVEGAIKVARTQIEAILAEAREKGGVMWALPAEPACPGAVRLGVQAPASTAVFCGSSAGLSQFESAAEIAEGLHEAEIREAKRIMEAEAAAELERAREAEQKDAEAIMPKMDPTPPRVKPDAPKELPPALTRLPQRDFYALMRRAFDDDTVGSTSLKEKFEEMDLAKTGALDAQQLRELVTEAVPDATAKELRHFEVLAMPGGDGIGIEDQTVTLEELRKALRGSQRAFKAARFRASATGSAAHTVPGARAGPAPPEPPPKVLGGLQQTLARIDDALEREQIPPRALFNAFDGDRDGKLDAGELKDMLWRLLPGLEADEVRFAMAHVFEHAAAEDPSTAPEAADVPGSGAAAAGEKRGTVTFEAFDDAITALRGAAEKQAE